MAAGNKQPHQRGGMSQPHTHAPVEGGMPSKTGKGHMGNGSGPVSPMTPKPTGASKKNPLH